MTESFLLTVVDGVWTVRRAENTSANYYQTGGAVPAEELPPALDIGMKVLAECKHHDDSYKYDLDDTVRCECGKYIFINWIPREPEKTGLAYLRSLPDGSKRKTPVSFNAAKFIKTDIGLVWVDNGSIWTWDGARIGENNTADWREIGWVTGAGPETCPPWHPEEK